MSRKNKVIEYTVEYDQMIFINQLIYANEKACIRDGQWFGRNSDEDW